ESPRHADHSGLNSTGAVLHVTGIATRVGMSRPVSARVKTRRDALRKSGLRPVQIWAPDSRAPGFAAECRRQSKAGAEAERDDSDLFGFMDAALSDLARPAGWR